MEKAKMEKEELGSRVPSVGRGSHGAISFCQMVIASNNGMHESDQIFHKIWD